ncbi:hypothetical protein [Nocardioides stalactiti]|uniref:hypothetical protein n=1 Tax=Nocardioides stalactiti TaxID=2755356 RepID=UPI0016047327|nr:hypothetical protein [Nocardioides stalactiti]
MHPNTPKRLERFAETHRQVGAICHAGNWMESHLEIAVSELAGTDDLSATQGDRASALITKLKELLNEGVVADDAVESGLRNLLSRISAAMSTRDQIVHSTWLYTNQTKPGHITGLRWRKRGEQRQDWSADQLEQVREDLEALADELSSAAWNATRPPNEWI